MRYITELSDKEKGKHDRNHIDWKRSIAKKKRDKEWNHDFVRDEISIRFGLITVKDWKVFTNGSGQHGHNYAQAVLQICVYFNHRFAKLRLNTLLGLATKHHNMDIAMKLLLKSGLMKEYENNYGENKYGIVEWISEHIRFENEDGIEEELTAMLSAGKAATNARILMINSGKNKQKNNTTNNSSAKKRENVLDDP